MKITNETLQALAENLWLEYCEIFPKLVKFDCPTITINNRFSTTGGMNYSEINSVQLAGKFFINNKKAMLEITLPHELAHQIDYNLNGWEPRQKYHRKQWCEIMVLIGLPPNVYHEMVL